MLRDAVLKCVKAKFCEVGPAVPISPLRLLVATAHLMLLCYNGTKHH